MIDGHGRLPTGNDGTPGGHQMSTTDQHDMTPSAARSVTVRIGVGLGWPSVTVCAQSSPRASHDSTAYAITRMVGGPRNRWRRRLGVRG
jgi:hypothetical protein